MQTQQQWGVGWDYLIKEYHDSIDEIVKNNVKGKYNRYLINGTAKAMCEAMDEAKEKSKKIFPKEKNLILKIEKIQLQYLHAETLQDEVIFITLTEQFLRSIY